MNLEQANQLKYGDPIWNTMAKRRERFQELTADGMVITMTNDDCLTCPDYCHPTQIEKM